MNSDVPGRNSFNPRALGGFVFFCAILGGLIALHSRWLGTTLALAYFGALVLGSLLVIVLNMKGRRGAQRANLAQTAVLPKSWRKWILDEDDVNRG